MKKRTPWVWLLAVLAVTGLILSACGSDDDGGNASDTGNGNGSSKTTTSAKSDLGDTDLGALKGTLDGQGSSLQDTFEQDATKAFNAEVKKAGGSATVKYTKSGSSDGRKALADQTSGFAGSDGTIKDEEKASFSGREILYFPLVGSPITLSYNVKGVDKLNLSPETIAGIFQTEIKTWDDPAIKKDNPDAKLPSTPITVVHRSDGSGTTNNFTKYLKATAPDTWKLDAGDTVEWAASTQGAEKSTGVASVVKGTDGAIGYLDLADAAKENLDVASVANSKGDFVAPTPDSASAALGAAEVKPDLTFDPLNSDGKGAYPITSPTWILVDAKQKDQATADLVKAYILYAVGPAQADAKSLLYAPLPKDLAKQAQDQAEKITAG